MTLITNSYLYRVISGEARGPGPMLLRGLLNGGEFFYSSAVRTRNFLYDRKILKSHQLPVPVISVGNITAGGTGKTPIVRYLATSLTQRGMQPAILMRGYKRSRSGISDEQSLLADQLSELKIPVHANPDRVAGGRELMQKYPQTDVIVLDDGFQHRRLMRAYNIILIDATNPFGFGHVHPRGLLREPLSRLWGLGVFTAIILTRCEQVSEEALEAILGQLQSLSPSSHQFCASFIHNGFRNRSPASAPPDMQLNAAKSCPIFLVAGIANPKPLADALKTAGADVRGHWWLPDHHDYTQSDLIELRRRAKESGASTIITTEKDWVKIKSLPSAGDKTMPIWRLDLDVRIDSRGESDEKLLWDALATVLRSRIERPQENGAAQADDAGENKNRQHHPDAGP
jgi:tetraacyldisaccharide 4'-kinase